MRDPHFFQNCGTFCFDLYWKYHNFERNEIRETGFLKWTDFSNQRFSSGTDCPNQIFIASTIPETIWGYCTQLGATLGEINVIVSNCLPDRGSTGWGHFPTYHTPLIRRHVDISVTSVLKFEGAHVICCSKIVKKYMGATMRTNLPKILDLLLLCILSLNFSLKFFIMIFFVTIQLNISKFLPPQIHKTLISY